MAASEPAPNVHSWTEDVQSSDLTVETKALEMGMSGMSLVSTTYSSGPERKETESTLESSSPKGYEGLMNGEGDQQAPPPPPPPPPPPMQQPPPSDRSESGSVTASLSPASDRQQHYGGATSAGGGGGAAAKGSNSNSASRPPGITVAPLPSPIGKPGHSKNTSATSPLLTLTPNSSVDGNSDWHSLGARMSPPFQTTDVPALPFLQGGGGSDHQRRGAAGTAGSDDGAASLGSFDIGQDNGNDGLLGLEALRDRAYSSPGPVQMVSTSPPVLRGHFPAHSSASSTGTASSSQQLYEGQVEKPRTRERPPLSYSHADGLSNHQGDRANNGGGGGGMGFLPPQNRSGSAGPPDASNNISFESSDSRSSFGAIGRPELRQTASDFDMRRRASSQENYQYMMQHQQQQNGGCGGGMQDPSQKFGSLPSLSNHIQQQRMPDNMAELQRPRHVRSVSTPMPANVGISSQQVPGGGMDSRYYQTALQQEGHSYSGENKYKSSVSHPSLSSSFDANQYAQQKRVSMPNLGGVQQLQQGAYGQQQPGYMNLPRRDGMEYQMGGGGAVMSSAEEMRTYPLNPSMISPGHSPMQAHYGSGQSRHSADGGSAMLSSSPRSLGGMSGMSRGSMGSMIHHPMIGGDEDLAHPLVGEHIDVPAEHDDVFSSNSYTMGQSLPPHGMQQQQRHGHSVSMDQQMLPQFIETPHHLPTAGAALPMPKVVYSVKFKRTQRNFVLGPRINRDLKIGTYVKVEADRGEDLGIVVGKLPADKYNFSNRTSFSSVMGAPSGVGGGDLKRIIRLATHDEVSLLSMKRDEEEELLNICLTKVRQRGLPMNVVDAEYQFDRHKLTFFFEAEGRVDFRELVRDLFSMYKTRIWMQQLDKNTSTSSPAITAPHPSTLQIDYGTPIIAPVSDYQDSLIIGGQGC